MMFFSAANVAAQARPTAPRPPDNPIESRRLERLQTLADLWGKIYLSHPYVATTSVDWDRVLTDAIPKVERAGEVEEFVRVLNDALLRPLGDPLALVHQTVTASAEQSAASGASSSDSLGVLRLAGSLGYVNAGDPGLYSSPGYVLRIDSAVRALGPVQTLVVDLRWRLREEAEFDPVPAWLGLWARTPLPVSGGISRIQEGWFGTAGGGEGWGEQWRVARARVLEPANWRGARNERGGQRSTVADDTSLTVRAPTVFLVNNTSYGFLAAVLDALQSQPNVAVLWEQTGSFVEESRLLYPEGLEARLNTTMVRSYSGSLGAAADYIAIAAVSEARLPDLVRSTLTAHANAAALRAARRDFTFEMRRREQAAPSMEPLTREQRLLDLFKLRSVLDNFFAHLEHVSLDWPNLLRDWIPRVEAAESLREHYLVLQQMGVGLNDSHVTLQHPLADPRSPGASGPYTVPFRLARVQSRVVVVSPAPGEPSLPPSVRLGDEVVAIDGRRIAELEAFYRSKIPASTDGAFYRTVWLQHQLPTRGAKDSTVTLTLRDGATTRRVTLGRTTRFPWPPDRSEHFRVLPGNLGYISLVTIPDSLSLEAALASLWNTTGLVLDLRGYPRFGMASSLLRRLGGKPVRSPLVDIPVLSSPSTRTLKSTHDEAVIPDLQRYYGKPVVVLIDARAQSMPEYIGIWLRNSRRVTFVGAATAGTTGTSAHLNLPSGARFYFTAQRVRYADGSRFQNIGILPDIPAEPTIDGVRQGRDEVLEKGMAVLKKLATSKPSR